MENTVDDFFNEINQIVPPKERRTPACDWQECFDNTSGYSYYWNMKTDQVTWSMPQEYKIWKEQYGADNKDQAQAKKSTLFPSALPSNPKMYNIQNQALVSSNGNKQSKGKEEKVRKNILEKVALIPAYGNGSDSESESEKEIKNGAAVFDSNTKENHTSKNNSDDENIDILAKIQNRAKILKDLGGELPPDVKKIVEQNGSAEKESDEKVKEDVSGFSLLASYGDSDDEDEELKVVETSSHNRVAVSTLFPIPKPIDVKQFLETEKPSEPQEEIDTKVFHRKRRIGIDFNVEKPKAQINDSEVDRQGLGFKCESGDVSENKSKVQYPGFKSAGVLFVKSDVLNSDDSSDKKEVEEDSNENKVDTRKKIEETHKMLNEKLTFLSEGREPAPPVQVIIIQMETLYEAMQAGCLTVDYLYKWLKQTCSELVKLEKEAAPSGWLLQWDRVNKRYYYRNQQTGESQWEYPQPDIVGGDDAMDICTTPPPTASETLLEDLAHSVQPPPPPRIKTPTPPPPPTISKNVKQRKKNLDVLPELPSSSTECFPTVGEPLPPGVDSPPEAFQLEKKSNDTMGSELDSFYSDLAALETNTNIVTSTVDTLPNAEICQTTKLTETTLKRKKKSKVKLVEGLSMKKKGVSKLVERWKSVQKDL